MASRVFLVITFVLFGFMLNNIEAAAIICGDDSTQKQTETVATSGATAILVTTANEKSLPNQEASADAIETTLTPTTTTTETSEVKKIFKTVQCSLERARPWVEEIEKEAKRLEETAKRIGEGVISRLGDFVERLTSNDENTNPTLRLFNRFVSSVGIGGSGVYKKVKPLTDVIIEKEQAEQEQEKEKEKEKEPEQQVPVKEILESSSTSSTTTTTTKTTTSTTTTTTTPAHIVALADIDESENQINSFDVK